MWFLLPIISSQSSIRLLLECFQHNFQSIMPLSSKNKGIYQSPIPTPLTQGLMQLMIWMHQVLLDQTLPQMFWYHFTVTCQLMFHFYSSTWTQYMMMMKVTTLKPFWYCSFEFFEMLLSGAWWTGMIFYWSDMMIHHLCVQELHWCSLTNSSCARLLRAQVTSEQRARQLGGSFSDIKLIRFQALLDNCLSTVQPHIHFGSQRPVQDNQKDQEKCWLLV